MNIICSCCGQELTKPGALLFAPPVNQLSRKYHLCEMCWELLKLPTEQAKEFIRKLAEAKAKGLTP